MAEVVQYAGDDEVGDPLFDMPLTIPDPHEFDPPPTARMMAAIEELFGMPLELTDSQAHAILCARDYGRQCVAKVMPFHRREIRDLFSKLVMIFVLAEPDRLTDVKAWSARRFDRQPDGAAVARTKRFGEVSAWLSTLLAECRAASASFTQTRG